MNSSDIVLPKTSNRSLILKIIIIVIALCIASAWFIYRDTSVPPRLSTSFFSELSLAQSIQEIADATVEGGAPGAIILVRKDGQEIVATSGIANKVTGVEMPADKALRIASVSKVYTATVVLSLANEGLIDLEANITDYLDENITNGVTNAKQATVKRNYCYTPPVFPIITICVVTFFKTGHSQSP